MASDLSLVEYAVEQMQAAGNIVYKKMFGEYALYCNGKVVALICDSRLYVKATKAGKSFIGDPIEAPPYPGAKPAFLIEEQIDDREWLCDLISRTEKDLPKPKPRASKKKKK